MIDLLQASATQLAAAIRTGEVSSREVVDFHIDRAQAFNPHMNAIVHELYDEARALARQADAKVAESDPADLPPFHGVPCTIKECFAFEGMEQTSGQLRVLCTGLPL